jgi:hypothetical protein
MSIAGTSIAGTSIAGLFTRFYFCLKQVRLLFLLSDINLLLVGHRNQPLTRVLRVRPSAYSLALDEFIHRNTKELCHIKAG